MIIISETLDIVLLLAGVFLAVGSIALFKFASDEVLRIAIGLPMALIGLSLLLTKIHEMILIIISPGRTAEICYFCPKS